MRACLKCSGECSTPHEIEESIQATERIAAKFPPIPFLNLDIAPGLRERARVRAELQRAGLCLFCAVEMRDDARDGQKGSN